MSERILNSSEPLKPARREIDQSSVDMVFSHAGELRESIERISPGMPLIIQESPLILAETNEAGIRKEGNSIHLKNTGEEKTLTAETIHEFAAEGNFELTSKIIETCVQVHMSTAMM